MFGVYKHYHIYRYKAPRKICASRKCCIVIDNLVINNVTSADAEGVYVCRAVSRTAPFAGGDSQQQYVVYKLQVTCKYNEILYTYNNQQLTLNRVIVFFSSAYKSVVRCDAFSGCAANDVSGVRTRRTKMAVQRC